MNKDTITIDGQTYIKTGAPADEGPSKEEIDACKAHCLELQKKSWKITFKLLFACWILAAFGGSDMFMTTLFISLFLLLPLYAAIALTTHLSNKTKFPKEVWDAMPQAPIIESSPSHFKPSTASNCSSATSPHSSDYSYRNLPGNIYHQD